MCFVHLQYVLYIVLMLCSGVYKVNEIILEVIKRGDMLIFEVCMSVIEIFNFIIINKL